MEANKHNKNERLSVSIIYGGLLVTNLARKFCGLFIQKRKHENCVETSLNFKCSKHHSLKYKKKKKKLVKKSLNLINCCYVMEMMKAQI